MVEKIRGKQSKWIKWATTDFSQAQNFKTVLEETD